MRSPLSVDLRERFRAYITDTLVPVLKRGDTVILDNLPAHKVAGVREVIEAAALSPALQSGLQPDRERLRQAQGTAAQGCRTHRARSLDSHPTRLRSPQPPRRPPPP